MNRRKVLACALSLTITLAYAQPPADVTIAPVRPKANILIRPYLSPYIPDIRPNNSDLLRSLVRGGAIYLTAQDAVALAIENNIDLEVARYNPLISDWRLERSEAGGALPGVPSGASQAGAVANGQGVQGSQTAAGVQGGGNGSAGARSTNASITQIGPVTQTLDPIIQQTSVFSHTSNLYANVTVSQTPNLIDGTRVYNTQIQQGFLAGGQLTLKATDNYLKENSPTDLLNPSWAPSLSISFQQSLFRGFGTAVNARNITVSRTNRRLSDLSFQQTVISTVAQVLDIYYNLAAANEDVASKRNITQVAGTLLESVQRQVQLGSVAEPELLTSQNLIVTSQQDLVNSQATARQLEISLKNLLSRTGNADPILGPARIVTVDKLVMPADDGLGEFSELVKEARANRVEFVIDRGNLESSRTSLLGTRNGILPNVQAFATETQVGLGGPAQINGFRGPDPYFIGGLSTGVLQILRRNFPSEQGGVFAAVPIGNRAALADQAIDELTLRQSELAAQKRMAQVEVDIQNGVIALRQARVQYEAATKNSQLQRELLEAEQKKYELGASIPTAVVQVQRDLTTSQSSELGALSSYIRARVTLDRTLGRTLETTHVTLEQAMSGRFRPAS